ncbi:transposase [Candidatus Daviesbacteria bacterium]|nr:transposase [Candidatus Daviesbacteria bacterium]
MTNLRKVVLANNQTYHIFNRAIDRQTIFNTKWEYKRAVETIKFYRFANLPFKLSQLLNLPDEDRQHTMRELNQNNERLVDIITFCIMPNHFHFMLKQLKDNGISKFIANFTNSYTKYFNTKHERKGHLFEGQFKAVLIENDEQLIHLSRYIHLNPVTSFIIKAQDLDNYQWSSFPEYLNLTLDNFFQKETILDYFSSIEAYKQFVYNQVKYAQELEKIKHLLIEV